MMKSIRNIAIVTVTLLVVGWMTVPAEARHPHRGYRGPSHLRHHHQFHRAPHHLHHHRHYRPHMPHHFRGPSHFRGPHYLHPRGPAFVHPFAPIPRAGFGMYGPGGGFHFRF